MNERGGSSGSDPIADFQRWLMRKSAQGLGGQLKDQARRTFSGNKPRVDVWEAATTEPAATGEAPECAWCPVCRAARRLRDSGPGFASHVAGAGDALFSVAQDALAAFDATLASSAKPPQPRSQPERSGRPDSPARSRPSGRPGSPARSRPSGRPGSPAKSERPEVPGSPAPAGRSETPEGRDAARPAPAMGPDEPDDRH